MGALGRIFFAPQPLGPRGGRAFVYPGSGSQFSGMGREACLQWPAVVREQDRGNDRLRSQFATDSIWRGGAAALTDARTVILSQVALGTIATDLMAGFGVRPDAVVGYSLGETAGLFSLGAWHERDEMLRRTMESDLFVSSLTGECAAARWAWGLAEDADLTWLVGVVDRSADRVREALEGRQRVYLLIVNTPDECVIGGDATAVAEAVEALGAAFHALQGVPTVHCEVACEVEDEYRDLHLLDTRVPEGVRFYSGASGEAYEVDRESAADSLLAQAIHGVDFPQDGSPGVRGWGQDLSGDGPGLVLHADDPEDPGGSRVPGPLDLVAEPGRAVDGAARPGHADQRTGGRRRGPALPGHAGCRRGVRARDPCARRAGRLRIDRGAGFGRGSGAGAVAPTGRSDDVAAWSPESRT